MVKERGERRKTVKNNSSNYIISDAETRSKGEDGGAEKRCQSGQRSLN